MTASVENENRQYLQSIKKRQAESNFASEARNQELLKSGRENEIRQLEQRKQELSKALEQSQAKAKQEARQMER